MLTSPVLTSSVYMLYFSLNFENKRGCELTQTDRDLSLLPTAQQQYGQLGFGELPFFCFFLKIFGLNF